MLRALRALAPVIAGALQSGQFVMGRARHPRRNPRPHQRSTPGLKRGATCMAPHATRLTGHGCHLRSQMPSAIHKASLSRKPDGAGFFAQGWPRPMLDQLSTRFGDNPMEVRYSDILKKGKKTERERWEERGARASRREVGDLNRLWRGLLC